LAFLVSDRSKCHIGRVNTAEHNSRQPAGSEQQAEKPEKPEKKEKKKKKEAKVMLLLIFNIYQSSCMRT